MAEVISLLSRLTEKHENRFSTNVFVFSWREAGTGHVVTELGATVSSHRAKY